MEPLDHLKAAVTAVETALTALSDRTAASETATADLTAQVTDMTAQITALNDRVTIAEKAAIRDHSALYSSKEYKKVRVRYFTPDEEAWERQPA